VATTDSVAASREGAMRWFMVGMSCWFIVVAIAGFTPSYMDYMAGAFPIDWLVHLHGAIMASWLGLFFTQTYLAATGRMSNHFALGLAGTALAGLVWAFMWIMNSHGFIGAKFPEQEFLISVLLAQLEMTVLFPIYFLWGFLVRGTPDWHRRLMIFATAVTLQAAVDRMHWLPVLDLPLFWDHALRLYVIVLSPLYVFDLLTLGRLHRATLACTAIVFAAHAVVSALLLNEGWHAFIHAILARFG
jgi:hypothetical protein